MALHRHHIKPRHAGGTDDPCNIEVLTIDQHAEAHRILFEKHGRWQDRCAWLLLSGQITAGEAATEAARRVNTGRPKTKLHRLKLSEAKRGKKMSSEACEAMCQGQLGRKHSPEVRSKIGSSQRGKVVQLKSIEKYVESRQSTDGTPVLVQGRIFPSHSAAAHAMADIWKISLEAARGRIRTMSRSDSGRAYIAMRERMKRHVQKGLV